MPISYDSSSLLKCTVSFSYLRYVINDVVKKPSTTPGTIGDPLSAKPGSKQTPALTKETQNTGELNSIDDIINRGKVGDKVSASLAADLNQFARGDIFNQF